MRMVRRLLGLALIVAVLVGGWRFASHNPASVHVDYLVGTVDEPLWLVLTMSFGAGALTASLVGLYHSIRLSLVARRYRRIATGLEGEIHELRNLPLAGQQQSPLGHQAGPARGAGGAPTLTTPDRMDRSG
jgi:uncharacterized integral membrane protein